MTGVQNATAKSSAKIAQVRGARPAYIHEKTVAKLPFFFYDCSRQK